MGLFFPLWIPKGAKKMGSFPIVQDDRQYRYDVETYTFLAISDERKCGNHSSYGGLGNEQI